MGYRLRGQPVAQGEAWISLAIPQRSLEFPAESSTPISGVSNYGLL